MPMFDDIRSFFENLFSGEEEDEGAELEGYTEDEDIEGYGPDVADYITEYSSGEWTGLPPVDYETGVEYCSGAPEGILEMVLSNPEEVDDGEEPEYEIYRNES